MTWSDNVVAAIAPLLKEAIDRFGWSLIILVVLLSTAVTYILAIEFFRGEFELVSGPSDSTGGYYSEQIISDYKELKDKGTSPFSRIKYISQTPSSGFLDSFQQVASDESGKVFGFAQDGFVSAGKEVDDVRILLPLEKNYLFVLCNKEYIDRLNSECGCNDPSFLETVFDSIDSDGADETPPTPDDVPAEKQKLIGAATADKINVKSVPCDVFDERPMGLFEFAYFVKFLIEEHSNRVAALKPKIYVGPEESGTKQLADSLLEHYGMTESCCKKIIPTQEEGFRDLVNKLNSGEADLAFFVGSRDDEKIKKLARERKTFLLSLGNDVEGIVAASKWPLEKGHLFRNEFGGTNVVRVRSSYLYLPGFTSERPFKIRIPTLFCEGIEAISTRRVLICSKNMHTNDAYAITQFSRKSLAKFVPILEWDKGPQGEVVAVKNYAFEFHDGSTLVRENSKPFPTWLIALSTALFGSFVAFVFSKKKLAEIQKFELRDEQFDAIVAAIGKQSATVGDGEQNEIEKKYFRKPGAPR